MLNCLKKPLPVEVESISEEPNPNCKVVAQKPVVVSTQRYEKIRMNAFQSEKIRSQKEADEEHKYREYLKKGSDELVAQFGTAFGGPIEDASDTEKELDEARTQFNQTKENDEQVRRERIVKAQQLVEKLKPGPRELQSAAVHSEVLRARNVQRNINAEFERAIRQNELEEKANCTRPMVPGVQEEEQRVEKAQQQNNKYKQELFQTIRDNSKNRNEYKKQLIQEQLAERDAVDAEIKAQIDREKAIMEKKRATLRKNALEAMKMVEQRRMRERMTEEIDDRLCCNYTVGKRQLDTMLKEHSNQQKAEKAHIADLNMKRLANLQQNNEAQEDERLRRDISRMQLKFTAEEAEKKRKDKAAKQARIEAYMRELQMAKEAQRRADEEKRFDMAQRFKNHEVNCMYDNYVKEERDQKAQELRTQFMQQLEAKNKADKIEKAAEVDCMQQRYEKDDKFFFEYAKNLIEDAQRKERPLQPFAKVVHQYKVKNQIDCANKQPPPHLMSQLDIGRKCETDKKEMKMSKMPPNTDKEQILDNCLKINEILAAAGGEDDKYKKECELDCPVTCFKPSPYATEVTEKEEKGAQAVCRADANKFGDPSTKRWSKLQRYTMHELKTFNKFPAPNKY